MASPCWHFDTVNLVVLVCLSLLGLGKTDTVCPKGWMANEGNCYLFGKQPVHFVNAESYCRLHNGHLVELSDAHENTFVKDRLRDFKAKHWWIGITDEAAEGEWVRYTDKAYIKFSDWNPGQPEPTKDEDCAIFAYNHDYHWYDTSCITLATPICEMRGDRCRPEVVGTVSPGEVVITAGPGGK